MSYLIEMIGRGLDIDFNHVLARLYWMPQYASLKELTSPNSAIDKPCDAQIRQGISLLGEDQPAEAINHLDIALETCDNVRVRTALACAYEDTGKTPEALENLASAVDLCDNGEDKALIYFTMGFCCEKLGKRGFAADHYRSAIGFDDSYLPARQRLGAISLILGDLDEAIAQYSSMREAEPADSKLRATLAHLLYRAGSYSKAVDEFETVIAMEPENWAMSDDEVDELIGNGQLETAIEYMERAIESQGPFPDLYVRLGDLLAQHGKDDQALARYRTALDLQPNYLEAMVKMGTHHLVQGRWEEAAETFFQAAEINDFLLANYVGVGVSQLSMGQHDKAMKSFDLAAAIEPNTSLLFSEMARLQLKSTLADRVSQRFKAGKEVSLSDLDLDARELLTRQLARHDAQVTQHGDHADVRYRYGVLLRADGKLPQAREQFTAAVKSRPPFTEALIKLAITYQDLGRMDEAMASFIEAMNPADDQLDQHYALALLYTDRHRFDQAVRDMELAARELNQGGDIRAGLAISLQNLGLMDRSAATWRSLQNMPLYDHLAETG